MQMHMKIHGPFLQCFQTRSEFSLLICNEIELSRIWGLRTKNVLDTEDKHVLETEDKNVLET